jgi:hypothetical protein
MTLRELAVEAIGMAQKRKERSEIFEFVRAGARKLGQFDQSGDENGFEIRLKATGQVIRLNGNGYSYSPQ